MRNKTDMAAGLQQFINLHPSAHRRGNFWNEGLKARMADSEAEWKKYKSEYETVIKKAVAAYNEQFKKANFPALIL